MSTPSTDSEEWLANNLIGLISGARDLMLKGKRSNINWYEIIDFIEEYRPEVKCNRLYEAQPNAD